MFPIDNVSLHLYTVLVNTVKGKGIGDMKQ